MMKKRILAALAAGVGRTSFRASPGGADTAAHGNLFSGISRKSEKSSIEMKAISEEMKKISEEMKAISKEIKKISEEMKAISEEIKKISIEMKAISGEIKKISIEIKTVFRDFLSSFYLKTGNYFLLIS
jgi:peptidoglycan hydrolase CwlO-like protein